MGNIKGILFDKDGTLLDFNSIWIPVAISLVDEIVSEFAIEDSIDIKRKLLGNIGVLDGRVEPSGILAWGTSKDISEAFEKVLCKEKVQENMLDELADLVKNKIHKLTKEKSEFIKPIGNLIKLLEELKQRNIQIGLATSDSYESTHICLEQLEIKKYFNFIGTDDGITKSKPNPEVLYKFCETCEIKPTEVAMVGDTEIDMILAKNGNAALAIAVLSGTNDFKNLDKKPDYIINSVEELIDLEGNLLWNPEKIRI